MNKPLVAAMCFLALSATVLADPASDKVAITALYAKVDKAISNRDLATVKKNMAPGCKFKSKTGQMVDGKTAMTQAETQLKQMKSVRYATKLTSIDVKGDKATVKTSMVMEGVMFDPNMKRDLKIKQSQISVDTLVKSKGVWMLFLSESKSDKTTINGKTPEQFAKEMRDQMSKKGK